MTLTDIDWKKERAKLEGTSPEVLAEQLMKANKRVEVAKAQVIGLGAKQLKGLYGELDLVERVAFALNDAHEAAQAIQSVPLDPGGHHTPHPNDRAIPGSSTRRVRYQREKLERAIEDALDTWEQVKENDFITPPKNKAPRVRCRKRDCVKYDRRVPAWDFTGAANEFCAGCGDRLPKPEEAA